MPALMKILDEAQILARICKIGRNLHDSNKKYTLIYIFTYILHTCIYIHIIYIIYNIYVHYIYIHTIYI